MSELKNIEQFFFIGIGGIGMSALARYFHQLGKQVAGYDGSPSKMTQKLSEEGILIQHENSSDSIPEKFKNKETLVIYTPAIQAKNVIFQYFEQKRFEMKKRSEVLGMISREMPTLAIAGTHGKTTTSAILAHLLKESGFKITAFLGGVAENFQSNFIGEGTDALVVEADEFDRSFLLLTPDFAGITSIEADHLDSYGSLEELNKSFRQFVAQLKNPDRLFLAGGMIFKGKKVLLETEADYCVKNLRIKNESILFDFKTPKGVMENLIFHLPGNHNLRNAALACAMALEFGAEAEKTAAALSTFKGVDRRFTYHLKNEKNVLIEDYAHHPTEINAVRQAMAQMHPERKVLAVFQPHLYSRTRDFQEDFAKSLDQFDEVIVLPIFPAREEPLEGISSETILKRMKLESRKSLTKPDLASAVKKSECSAVVLLGAGDIGEEAERIKETLLL